MTQTETPRVRNHALDGLRGLAALSVVVTHIAYMPVFYRFLTDYPWSLVIIGHNAVVLFFVLSGYVLTFQAASNSYPPYLIKRFCRIYLPYLAVILAAAAIASVVPHTNIAYMGSPWIEHWDRPITAQFLGQHILFLFPFDATHIVAAIWSLVHEMRISLIFPLIYWVVMRFGAVPAVIGGALCSGVASYLVMHHHEDMFQLGLHGGWLPTVHYAFMFVCGAALSTQRARFERIFANSLLAVPVFAASLVIFVCSHPLALIGKFSLNWMLYDWISTLGSLGMIACLLALNPVARFFNNGLMQFLGRISYSLYLTHIVVAMTIFRCFTGILPFWAMLLSSVIAIPIVGYACYRWIELPTIRLGYAWAKRVAPPSPVPVQVVSGEVASSVSPVDTTSEKRQ